MQSQFFQPIIEAVRESGEILRPHFGAVEVLRNKGAYGNDVVTELDFRVEDFLRDRFKKIDPTIGFWGEERGKTGDEERFWLVDPIDGTAHFERGIPFCTTMVALVDKGEVVFSIINNFSQNLLYLAEKGKGAFCNEEKLGVSTRKTEEAYVLYEINIEKKDNLAKMIALHKRFVLLHTINCGFEFAMVASGKLEARVLIDPWGKEWDFAPGSLLVSEAGGTVRNLGSETYDYRNKDFIAGSPHIVDEIQNILAASK